MILRKHTRKEVGKQHTSLHVLFHGYDKCFALCMFFPEELPRKFIALTIQRLSEMPKT